MRGSILRSCHHSRSLPVVWMWWWWMAQSGTVNSSLTLSEPSGLRVAHVVSVRGRASADEARLACDEAQMLLAANSLRFADGQDALVDLGTGRFRRWSSGLTERLARFSGLTSAMAHRLRWLTSCGAIPDFGKWSCFRLLFIARTVSTFCSQMANRSSISLSLGHRLAQGAGKLTWLVEACFLDTRCRAQHPRANRRRSLLASSLAHAGCSRS